MLLNLRNVVSRGEHPQFSGEIEATHLFSDRNDVGHVGKLQYTFEAEAMDESAVVSGELSLTIQMTCSRCLTSTDHRLITPFREIFVQSDEFNLDDNEDHIHTVHEDRVDLLPYIEENILLAVPYVPLCSEDCKGLCPVCGVNRNEEVCGCVQEKIDPRLAGLADFFKR